MFDPHKPFDVFDSMSSEIIRGAVLFRGHEDRLYVTWGSYNAAYAVDKEGRTVGGGVYLKNKEVVKPYTFESIPATLIKAKYKTTGQHVRVEAYPEKLYVYASATAVRGLSYAEFAEEFVQLGGLPCGEK